MSADPSAPRVEWDGGRIQFFGPHGTFTFPGDYPGWYTSHHVDEPSQRFEVSCHSIAGGYQVEIVQVNGNPYDASETRARTVWISRDRGQTFTPQHGED